MADNDPYAAFGGPPPRPDPSQNQPPGTTQSPNANDPYAAFGGPPPPVAAVSRPAITTGGGGTLGDIITSPDANAADIPQSQTPTPPFSLSALRDRMQQGESGILDRLRPGPNAGVPEQALRTAAAVGVHGLSTLLQAPVNVLMGFTQEGPQFDPETGKFSVPGATIDPSTGRLGVTPEAAAAGSTAALPLQFSSPNGLMRVPPSTLTRLGVTKDLPVTADELMAAVHRADYPPPPTRPPGESQASIEASGGYQGGPSQGQQASMTAAEMLERSEGFFSPADKQAAQGAMIHPGSADAVRKILTDAIPTDPEKAAIVGNTPLVEMGKAVQPYTGQPMSFDTAMSYDRQLTGRIKTALAGRDNDMARQLGIAQDAIREKMQSFGPNDTTGDPSALANLAHARQAYSQYIKQSQLEDIQYRASLLPEDRQDAYVRNQARSMLGSNKTRGWSPDERAVLEQAVKSGNIGTLTNVGISLVKPAVQGVGGVIGGSMFGTPGAFVGGQIGGEVGTTLQARVRGALSKMNLDQVSQKLTEGVPPPVLPNQLGPYADIPTITVRPRPNVP